MSHVSLHCLSFLAVSITLQNWKGCRPCFYQVSLFRWDLLSEIFFMVHLMFLVLILHLKFVFLMLIGP